MEHLNYKFTEDERQLRQYHRLRKLIYAADLNYHLEGLSDSFDRTSHTLVVHHGVQCVGGVRLTVVKPQDPSLLPMEDEHFRLKDLLPEIDFSQAVYGELSRLALLPKYRDGRVTGKIYCRIYQKCRQHGVKYLFAITPKAHARRYVLNARQMGFEARIADITIPAHQKEKYADLADCLVILEHPKRVSRQAEESSSASVVMLNAIL